MPIEYRFSGNVQGVGFRFRTTMIAKNYDVTGFVRNLTSGDVQLVVDGAPEVVRQFVDDVARSLAGYIGQVDSWEYAGHEQFSSFEIRR